MLNSVKSLSDYVKALLVHSHCCFAYCFYHELCWGQASDLKILGYHTATRHDTESYLTSFERRES